MPAHLPEYLPVAIRGTSYLIDPQGYRRTTVPILREQFDQSDEAGEQRLNTQTWVRSQTDWSYGAGQTFLDNFDSDRRRFSSSAGVDPWTKGSVKLLPLGETKNNANAWTDIKMRRLGSYLYVASGTDLYFSANPTAADTSVVWNQVSALVSPQTITDFTTDGTKVFIAYGSARVTATTGIGSTSVPSDLGSLNPDWVKMVSGKLVYADATVFSEMNASGAAAGTATTLLHAGTTWVDATAGPTGIYAAANGDTGSIYFMPVETTTGTLDAGQIVAELPIGETINAMEFYGGFLILATSVGLRLAAIDTTSGGVTYGPVITDGGAAFSLAVDERFVWWGGSTGQVYRADLSRFTDTLVPAWAADIVSAGDGNALGDVTYLARLSDETFFVDDGNGVQGPESTGILVASGTLVPGDVRWNSQFNKVLRTVEVRSNPTLVAGGNLAYNDSGENYDDATNFYNGEAVPVSGTINVVFQTDTGINTNVITAISDKTETVVTPALTSDRWTPTFTLVRDASDTTGGPQLESWMIQAFVAPTRIDEILLPIVLRRRVQTSRGMGAASTQNPQAIYDSLRTLMENKTVVTFEEGERSEQVVVDQMEMGQISKLSDDGDWWEGTLTVRLLTVPT